MNEKEIEKIIELKRKAQAINELQMLLENEITKFMQTQTDNFEKYTSVEQNLYCDIDRLDIELYNNIRSYSKLFIDMNLCINAIKPTKREI